MALATNTQTTYQTVGIREDLSNVVSRIDITEVAFQGNIGKSKATQRYHEWQTQALASANPANAALEGDITAATASTPRVRVGNRTQIFKKVGAVSDTARAVDIAGIDDELDEQKILKGLELRRDVEAALLQNAASVVGSDSTAPRMAGMESWLTSNVSRGTSGANGGFSGGTVAAPTDGTQRAFTQAQLDTVMQSVYSNGGKPTLLFLGPAQKTAFSAFTGIAVNRVNNDGNSQVTIVGGADVYLSNFGKLTVVPTIFSRARSALIIDPKMVKKATLRPMFTENLAKQGDATPFHVIEESTLEVVNEKAHGIIADLS
ncbi:hypothetical protein Sp245p_03540 [Azospirillum baldaniorum]|uniref:Phage Major head protein n=1 Tax=Azospirillum baldaniorum TaxID=1064539 RepID=A0A9P1JT62_9PROT|nr:DUF5309 domain-containing protein [Azospirillum baldaniorum]AWJ88927.1 hypothetical protein Sp245p_03540 [Azospirillum baldaniorum]TWA73361.1 hypothetical protein FBZ85_11653 [Azospirillum brasilense]CCC99360.1 putative phage Major head protein [Azospirillum baldaniorum]